MRLSIKIRQLWQEDCGVVAVLVAVFLSAFIGLMGAGIDLGLLYAARGELQNAADAAALAAADDLVTDVNGDSIADSNYGGAESTAHQYVDSNKLAKDMLVWSEQDLFEAGLWDFEAKTFSRTGDTGDPDDLDAVRVTLNRTVNTWFARIFGIDSVDIRVRSTGYLGCAGNGGKADVPIAVNESKLTAPGQALNLNSETVENIQWTSFFTWPSNTTTVLHYINTPGDIPSMLIGQSILFMTNGTTTPLLQAVEQAYNNNQVNGEWHVVLPVLEWDTPPVEGLVKGFVHYKITEVIPTGPNKGIKGYWADGGALVAEGAGPGGVCYGVRSDRPALIN